MPEPKVLTVKVTQLQVDDWILGETPEQHDVRVTKRPDVKQKYAYVPYERPGVVGQLSILKGKSLQVSRLVPTEDEQIAADRAYVERFIRQSCNSAAENLERTRETLIDSLSMRSASWHGSRWESYTAAQAVAQIWLDVVQVCVVQDVDLVEAVKWWKQVLTTRLVEDLRLTSRSTNQVSNIADDIVRDAQAAWIRNLDYVIM